MSLRVNYLFTYANFTNMLSIRDFNIQRMPDFKLKTKCMIDL